ncbi:MAG: amino acid-binding protein [Phycisphaerae bacterium]|nr:amino acid-binding protein [Phycisphaerae bacterium]MCZ2398339.1 amino acid-binding protein [Phycisphaerae bacterium]
MSNANDLRTGTQFSVFLANKPGTLASVVQRLADDKINIVALSMMDATEHGVLRLITGAPDEARRALNGLDLPKTEQTVLMATLPNRSGALADVLARLASGHINVHYAYCTTGAAGGRTTGIFKVDNVQKALQVLGERKPRRKSETMAVRGNSRPRPR